MGLESLEARIVVHEKNEAVYEEDIAFSKYDVQVKDISIKDLKNHQISATDKTGLGYDGQVNKSEVLNNMFDSSESDGDDNQLNDRFKKDEGYHAVPPPYSGNYMPPRADLLFAGLDSSTFKSKKLGDGFEFKKKACFVCGSINHLIKDCDFYENQMVLNNKGKITGPKEIRPVWNNTARVNHQNKLTQLHSKRNFVPTSILTKSGQVLVNASKQSSHRAAASISAARHMTGNKSYLTYYQQIDSGFDAFEGNAKGGGLTYLFAKATLDESNLWHKRLGHINFKTMNKLVRGNLVRGLPSKLFENDHTFVACQKGKQHKVSCTKANIDAGQAVKKTVPGLQYLLLPLLTTDSQDPKSSEDEVADVVGKKSIEVPRKENGLQDPAKEGDKMIKRRILEIKKAPRKQFKQEFERSFSQGKDTNTNRTNRLKNVSSPVNVVSSSFTTMDPGRERTQRNEIESMFGQEKDSYGNRIFTPVSATRSTYVYLGGSIPINAATLSNANLPTDPLMTDLVDTANL
uniref:Ribonuclease H-like domain-containing protein n=1 Tax=Tanacetum cinerariifolium TaxID=118510 RepID=A0A6L2LQ11_TANCI|nr:ribonuclease H-like domain-containing protein [Tanacetum cinerariifolium]